MSYPSPDRLKQQFSWRERVFVNLLRSVLHHPWMVEILKITSALYLERSSDWFDLEHVTLHLPRLDPEFDGFRLAQLTDFHFGTWINRKRLEQAVRAVNQWQPDAIVLTGDFVTHMPERFMPDLRSVLGTLHPSSHRLAILGNHDHWTNPTMIRHMLADAKITILDNSIHTITRLASRLHIGGIDDYMTGYDRLDRVLAQLPADGCAILLAHEPDFADISAKSGRFDLQLSGHSHGGQIKLPIIGIPLLPWYGRKYPAGLYHVDDMYTYTSRGLGTSEIQIRINVRPEVTFFTLKCSKSS